MEKQPYIFVGNYRINISAIAYIEYGSGAKSASVFFAGRLEPLVIQDAEQVQLIVKRIDEAAEYRTPKFVNPNP